MHSMQQAGGLAVSRDAIDDDGVVLEKLYPFVVVHVAEGNIRGSIGRALGTKESSAFNDKDILDFLSFLDENVAGFSINELGKLR